jgi:hypothetical protein
MQPVRLFKTLSLIVICALFVMMQFGIKPWTPVSVSTGLAIDLGIVMFIGMALILWIMTYGKRQMVKEKSKVKED